MRELLEKVPVTGREQEKQQERTDNIVKEAESMVSIHFNRKARDLQKEQARQITSSPPRRNMMIWTAEAVFRRKG